MRSWGSIAGIVILMLSFAGPLNAQEKPVDEGVLRLRSSGPAMVNGRRHLVVQAEIVGGRAVQVAVPNNDEERNALDPRRDIADAIKGFKPGDLMKVSLEPGRAMPFIKSVEAYELHQGEDTPNGYVFKESYPQGTGKQKATVVELTKFGQATIVAIPTRKSEKGEMEPDPDILGAVNLLKEGDPVWVQLNGKMLTAIELYKDPTAGKFVKAGDTEIDGRKVRSIEVEQDGKAVTLLLPGKAAGKAWVPDPLVARQLQRLRPGMPVLYRDREDGDKLWLREIAPAPKAPPEPKKSPMDSRKTPAMMKDK